MAFNETKLIDIGGGNGFRLCHYRTRDRLSEVLADGYFCGDRYLGLRVGDFIHIHAGVIQPDFATLAIAEVEPVIKTSVLASTVAAVKSRAA